MTRTALPLRVLPILLVLTVLAPATVRAEGEGDPPSSPPADWVARVGDRYLTAERLARATVWRVMSDLMEGGSGPTTVLRQMVQGRVVSQEAERLGVQVTDAELRAKFGQLDARVRRMANGAKNLEDVIIRDQGLTVPEFMQNLRHEMLKEKVAAHQKYLGLLPQDEKSKIAQIEVVIGELLAKAKVEYGIPCAMQPERSDLGEGVIALVNGRQILHQEFGHQLVLRLPGSRIKEIIQEECRAVLTAAWALTPEQMEALIAVEKERWLKRREMTTQEALRTVSYEDWVKMQYKLDLEGLKRDRYFRGLYGLVEAYRKQVEPEEIQKDYTEKKETMFGDRFLVTDVQIAFAPRDDLLGPSGGRTRREALQLANGILRRVSSGVEFDTISREVNEQRNGTFFSRRLNVRNTGNGRHLYEQAKLLQDGQVSRPFETLAEVHVVRREKWIPAPTFDDVEDLIRQRLAFQKAHEYLETQMGDAQAVEIRWGQPAATDDR